MENRSRRAAPRDRRLRDEIAVRLARRSYRAVDLLHELGEPFGFELTVHDVRRALEVDEQFVHVGKGWYRMSK